jgi:GxxExxY protein
MSFAGARNRRLPQMAADMAPSGDLGAYRHAGITKKLLDCFYDVYHELGSGFLEAVYCNAFAVALAHETLAFRREFSIPVFFRGVPVGTYRADFLIANEIIVELKAARTIDPVHIAQVVNYLRGSTVELGYVFNFGPKPSYKRLILSNERKSGLRQSAAICGFVDPGATDDTPSS